MKINWLKKKTWRCPLRHYDLNFEAFCIKTLQTWPSKETKKFMEMSHYPNSSFHYRQISLTFLLLGASAITLVSLGFNWPKLERQFPKCLVWVRCMVIALPPTLLIKTSHPSNFYKKSCRCLNNIFPGKPITITLRYLLCEVCDFMSRKVSLTLPIRRIMLITSIFISRKTLRLQNWAHPPVANSVMCHAH